VTSSIGWIGYSVDADMVLRFCFCDHFFMFKCNKIVLILELCFFNKKLFCSNSNHSSTAKSHIEKIVGFFTKIDPVLGTKAANANPSDNVSTDSTSKKSTSDKKRKNDRKDVSSSSPNKKKAIGNNGSMTLSEREKRAMELLSSYLEECGGTLQQELWPNG